ncbi:MAG: hypothetical protein IAE64_01110 [Flavobacteriales bacterium]|nr:hypothetical protein [Flavobacteriales bacterium]
MKDLIYVVGDITFGDLDEGRASPIDVHEAQVTKWLLEPASYLAKMKPTIGVRYEHGMSLFALELMFFEPHGQYITGEDSQGKAGKIFLEGFNRFLEWLKATDRVAENIDLNASQFLDWSRNGLFHSGQVKDGLLVDIRNLENGPFNKNPAFDGWLVDPWELLKDIREYFLEYINVLRKPVTPEHRQLFANFQKTFDRLIVPPDQSAKK